MRYLAKTSLLHKETVIFPDGRSVTFKQNMIESLSEDEAAYLKKHKKALFANLLKLKQKCKPMEQVFDELAEALQEMISAPSDQELEKLIEDSPELNGAHLIEVELVEGEEPEPEKKPKSRKTRKSEKTSK